MSDNLPTPPQKSEDVKNPMVKKVQSLFNMLLKKVQPLGSVLFKKIQSLFSMLVKKAQPLGSKLIKKIQPSSKLRNLQKSSKKWLLCALGLLVIVVVGIWYWQPSQIAKRELSARGLGPSVYSWRLGYAIKNNDV